MNSGCKKYNNLFCKYVYILLFDTFVQGELDVSTLNEFSRIFLYMQIKISNKNKNKSKIKTLISFRLESQEIQRKCDSFRPLLVTLVRCQTWVFELYPVISFSKPNIQEDQIYFCDLNNSFDNHYEPTNRCVGLAKKILCLNR